MPVLAHSSPCCGSAGDFQSGRLAMQFQEVMRHRLAFTDVCHHCEAAPVFLDVTKGLQHLHQNGIVHRDLKPENILMCDGMVAKLADFGWCAEIKKDGGGRNTFCGTMDYLSPEMVNNQPHDHTVDVWSLGVLLFEMLVGRAPFTSANQMKAMALIMTAELEVPDFISAAARDLMRRLIVKEREKRLSLQATIEHQWVTSNTSAADDISAAALEAAASHAVHREVHQQDCKKSRQTVPPKMRELGTSFIHAYAICMRI
eukprot:2176400-Amphidinium_carterae.1